MVLQGFTRGFYKGFASVVCKVYQGGCSLHGPFLILGSSPNPKRLNPKALHPKPAVWGLCQGAPRFLTLLYMSADWSACRPVALRVQNTIL